MFRFECYLLFFCDTKHLYIDHSLLVTAFKHVHYFSN